MHKKVLEEETVKRYEWEKSLNFRRYRERRNIL